MPSIKVVPDGDSSRIGYGQVQVAFGPGATGPLQIVAPASKAPSVARLARQDPGIAAVLPAQAGAGPALVTAIPKQDPSDPAVGQTIDRLRSQLPSGALIGGAVAENHDLAGGACGQDAARDRRRPGARLPAAPGRAPGAADRRGRRR